MARKSRLLGALDAHRGRDYEAEKQKRQRKQGEKRAKSKRTAAEPIEEDDSEEDEALSNDGVAISLEALAEVRPWSRSW